MNFKFKFATFAAVLLWATSASASVSAVHVHYDGKSGYSRSVVGTSSFLPALSSDRLLAHNEHHHGHDAPPPKPSHGHDAPPPKPSHGHDAPPPKPSKPHHGPMVIPPGPGVGPGPHPHH